MVFASSSSFGARLKVCCDIVCYVRYQVAQISFFAGVPLVPVGFVPHFIHPPQLSVPPALVLLEGLPPAPVHLLCILIFVH